VAPELAAELHLGDRYLGTGQLCAATRASADFAKVSANCQCLVVKACIA
jgi:hypothetical protein